MKHALLKTFMLSAVVLLSACDKGGGGGGGGGQQVAQVPGPQGRILLQQTDTTNYCDFNGGTVICARATVGNACSSTALPYSDLTTMCTQLAQLQNSYNLACNVSTTAAYMYSQYCSGVAPTANPALGTNVSNDPNNKTIQCTFQASRVSHRRFFGDVNTSTPQLTATYSFPGNISRTFDLQQKFFGIFNIGAFGTTSVTYQPAGAKGTADTLVLSNSGLNKSLNATQSGFAGQTVDMNITSEDGTMVLNVSCAGQAVAGQAAFRKNVAVKQFTQYVCRGTSNLYGSKKEDVLVSFPYNSSLTNSELNIAENLTATVTGENTGADNARITFNTHGIAGDSFDNLISIQSSAYLKTKSQLKASDGFTKLDLTLWSRIKNKISV